MYSDTVLQGALALGLAVGLGGPPWRSLFWGCLVGGMLSPCWLCRHLLNNCSLDGGVLGSWWFWGFLPVPVWREAGAKHGDVYVQGGENMG